MLYAISLASGCFGFNVSMGEVQGFSCTAGDPVSMGAPGQVTQDINPKIIRILHECEALMENLSLGSRFGITRLRRMMPNSDPRDRFVDQYLKLMIDSFSCTPVGADALDFFSHLS